MNTEKDFEEKFENGNDHTKGWDGRDSRRRSESRRSNGAPRVQAAAAPELFAGSSAPDYLGPGAAEFGDRLGNIYDGYDCEAVAKVCPVFAEFVRTRGRQLEPIWRGCLSIAEYSLQGREFAHEHSKGHERYSPRQVDEKLEYWRRNSNGPATCDYFQRSGAADCHSCPHAGRRSNPASLSRERPDEQPAGFARANGHAVEIENLPEGFSIQNGSLVFTKGTKGGDEIIEVSKHAIRLKTVQRLKGKNDTALVLEQYKPHRGRFLVEISNEDMSSPGRWAKLGKQGVVISNHELFDKFYKASFNMYHDAQDDMILYRQQGWQEDWTFLLGSTLYSPGGSTVVSVESDAAPERFGPRLGADAQLWRQAADKLFSHAFWAQGVVLLSGFGSIFMKLMAPDEGGIILNSSTQESGSGKSTSAWGATSPWGDQQGMAIQETNSLSTRTIKLSRINSMPTVHDELQSAKQGPIVMRAYVMWHSQAEPKTTTDRGGHKLHKADLRWSNIHITTDNNSLVEQLSGGDDVEDAPQMRVIELPSQVMSDSAFRDSRRLRAQLHEHGGAAGEIFIRFVIDNLDDVKKQLAKYEEYANSQEGWDSRHRFWARYVAAVCVAGEIVTRLKLVDLDIKSIIGSLLVHLRQSIKTVDPDWTLNMLGTFLDQHLDERLNVDRSYIPNSSCTIIGHLPRRISIRYEQASKRFYINSKVFHEWVVEQGRNHRHILNDLEARKILKSRRRFLTLGAGTPAGGAQVRCLEIDGTAILGHGLREVAIPRELESHAASTILERAP